jgi:hypothetical protein
MDKSVIAACRLNYFRLGLVNPHQWKNISELRADGGFGIAVTRYRRVLGEWKDKDATTGWPPVTYADGEPVIGVWSHRGGTPVPFAPGTYIAYDAVFYTLDDVQRYDVIVVVGMDPEPLSFLCESTVDKYDSHGGITFRVCQLRRRTLVMGGDL